MTGGDSGVDMTTVTRLARFLGMTTATSLITIALDKVSVVRQVVHRVWHLDPMTVIAHRTAMAHTAVLTAGLVLDHERPVAAFEVRRMWYLHVVATHAVRVKVTRFAGIEIAHPVCATPVRSVCDTPWRLDPLGPAACVTILGMTDRATAGLGGIGTMTLEAISHGVEPAGRLLVKAMTDRRMTASARPTHLPDLAVAHTQSVRHDHTDIESRMALLARCVRDRIADRTSNGGGGHHRDDRQTAVDDTERTCAHVAAIAIDSGMRGLTETGDLVPVTRCAVGGAHGQRADRKTGRQHKQDETDSNQPYPLGDHAALCADVRSLRGRHPARVGHCWIPCLPVRW